jgi:hypothetical protein
MNNKEFGVLINGRLFKAPSYFEEDGKYVHTNDPLTYLKHGYKEIVYLEELDIKPTNLIWNETETQIIQQAINDVNHYDYKTLLKTWFADFKTELCEVNNSISLSSNYCDMIIKDYIKNKYLSTISYNYLSNKYNDEGIVNIVSRFNLNPINFTLEDVGVLEEIEKLGYCVVTAENKEQLDKDLIEKYNINTRFVYIGCAIKIEKNEASIITPFQVLSPLLMAAKFVGDHEKYSYKSIFCSLHMLLDEFLIKIARFYMSMFPNSVVNDGKIDAKTVFSTNSIDDVKDQFIDFKVEEFGYKSYIEKIEQLRKWGIYPTLEEKQFKDDIILFCEKRNILVHNSGMINKSFLRKISNTSYSQSFTIGDSIVIEQKDLLDALHMVDDLCCDLYSVLSQKFKL